MVSRDREPSVRLNLNLHRLKPDGIRGGYARKSDAHPVGAIDYTSERAGFSSKRFEWSINFTGHSKVIVQISTEPVYQSFPGRAVPADVHGILMRVATLEDTLHGKVLAWRDAGPRPSKRQKDLLDITRLVEAHPELDHLLAPDIAERLGQ